MAESAAPEVAVLHGLNAVAALKRRRARPGPADPGRSPRPQRRGRIEACTAPGPRRGRPGSPRPQRRGRIEAPGTCGSPGRPPDVLHGLNAVAALKLVPRRVRVEVGPVLHGLNAVAAL